tara:strand:+ start:3560 stop:4468 length:909 start_codon:yes stop_codon:yes gene_type:complete
MPETFSTDSNSLGDTPVIEEKTELEKAEDSEVNEFFDALDREVNDVTYDSPSKSEQATQPVEKTQQSVGSDVNTDAWETDSNPYKKRYSDSSKEAVRLSEQYKEVEPFVPVLQAMKNDSGLVDHVRDYLKNGGTPAKTIQEQLKLDEDFMFDANEAVSEPDSDSAKVMNAHVDSIVQQRIGQVLDTEKQKAMVAKNANDKKADEIRFREEHNMNEAEFDTMVNQAKNHTLTLDDIHYLLNRDKTATNVRNSTQEEMMNQMRNIRTMPTSNSEANNIGETRTTEEQLFESIFGNTSAEENLFG